MRIALLTKEYPPNVYGGAGVHVSHLAESLARAENRSHHVEVFHFGTARYTKDNLRVEPTPPCPAAQHAQPGMASLLDTLHRDASLAGLVKQADILHGHTWYTHLAGTLLKHLLSIPLVLTTHSLEPHRPWKREQLGGGYDVSSWIEKTAYREADGIVAVSAAMKKDVENLYGVAPSRVTVIPNGVDTGRYAPTKNPEVLARYRIDPAIPYVLMVSRITRQKGITHFLNACGKLRPPVQVVLCASAPDTEQIKNEVEQAVARLAEASPNPVIWVNETVPVSDLPALYSQAAVFVCPSVYEPFGIINLEAMSCATPVVASEVGGIPDAVQNGETGFLVPFKPKSRHDPEPMDPGAFAGDLAASINRVLGDPDLGNALSTAARRRVEKFFSWKSVAERTLAFYRSVLNHARER
jgi:glycogen synthase